MLARPIVPLAIAFILGGCTSVGPCPKPIPAPSGLSEEPTTIVGDLLTRVVEVATRHLLALCHRPLEEYILVGVVHRYGYPTVQIVNTRDPAFYDISVDPVTLRVAQLHTWVP